MKVLVLFGYFVIGLFLGGYTAITHADSIAATKTYTAAFGPGPCQATPAQTASTASALHSKWLNIFGLCADGHTRNLVTDQSSYTEAGGYFKAIYKIDSGGNIQGTALNISISYSCPSGYTGPDGSNNCTSTGPTCDLPAGSVLYSGYYDVGTSSSGTPPGTVCKNHCVGVGYTSGPDYTAMVNGVKHYYYSGYYQVDPGTPQQNYCATDTPTTTVANSPSAPSNTCPAGQAVGYVNGIPVCYDQPTPTTTTPPVSTTKDVQTTTAADGTTTQTTTETAANGETTTTVVVTPPAGSNQPQTTTKSITPPADPLAAKAFCDQNPNDPSCKANKSECELHPGTIGCMAPGDIPADGALDTKEVDFTITPVAVGVAGSCPASRTMNFPNGQTFQFSFQPFCDGLSLIRPMVLGLAWLAAGFILIGAFRGNDA